MRARLWRLAQHLIGWSFVLAVALFISWADKVTGQ